ncbi:MAG TPA: hypothetical protein VL049_07905 [Candidatus Dormibacteraeota bacterium]|nr:hypothetical protein [Candidatus Dormibacteraeota bacterium]
MKGLCGFITAAVTLGFVGVAGADVNAVTPSTNEINRTNGWAHVDQLSKGIGTTDLQVISTRTFWSCFEYRTDGDTSQILSENGGNNYNANVTDGLYPYVCENNSSETLTIPANAYVEVRMVFGAETDERFDWTRFDVLPDPCASVQCDDGNVCTDDSCDPASGACVYTPAPGRVCNDGDVCTATDVCDGVGDCVGTDFLCPTNKDECKKGGWRLLIKPTGQAFKNQGDCVSYVNTGK